MPSYKAKKGTWYVKFYYTDYTGERKAKFKRGFALKRDADEWERDFLNRQQYAPSMPFSEFLKLYNQDTAAQLREHSIQSKGYRYKRILPYFGDKPLNGITPKDVRQWHNGLIRKKFSQKYINVLHTELSTVFNHAMRFYNLAENPARKAGAPKVPTQSENKIKFWTPDEFYQVLEHITDELVRVQMLTLFWTGMRKGELYALRWGKIDLDGGTITIDESYQRLQGRDVFTPTKTGVVRTIKIPGFLLDTLSSWKSKSMDTDPAALVFPFSRHQIARTMDKAADLAGVHRIRVHDLRHSHASYLINAGFNVVLISKRLGHEKVSTTLDTYSHFFPTAESELVDFMEHDNAAMDE